MNFRSASRLNASIEANQREAELEELVKNPRKQSGFENITSESGLLNALLVAAAAVWACDAYLLACLVNAKGAYNIEQDNCFLNTP